MSKELDRLVSLSVGTGTTEDWLSVFKTMGDLAREVGVDHYVSFSSTMVGENDEVDEDLYYDANTLYKVRRALWRVLANKTEGLPASILDDMISALEGEGILFRERR